MKYPIVYMKGNGLTEKNKIKVLVEGLQLMEFNIKIEKLETDINDISNYNNTLLKPDTRERLVLVKNDLSSITIKISENKDIFTRLQNILKMKMNKIKSEQVSEAEILQQNYLENYAVISEKYEIYLTLSLEIEEILRNYGSNISDAKQIANDFGIDSSKVNIVSKDGSSSEESSDGEDSFYFM